MANRYGTMCTVADNPTPAQAAAIRKLRKLAADRRRAAQAEDKAIGEAIRVGVKQLDVAGYVERSREHVRLAARREGIESARPPTAGRHPQRDTSAE